MAAHVSRFAPAKKAAKAPPTFAEEAAETGAWLEHIRNKPAVLRWFSMAWHKHDILAIAIDGCAEAVDGSKTVEKVRKAVGIAVRSLGGPDIDWAKQATKKRDDD